MLINYLHILLLVVGGEIFMKSHWNVYSITIIKAPDTLTECDEVKECIINLPYHTNWFALYQRKVRRKPSSTEIPILYPNNFFALEISARLCFTSPFLSGPYSGLRLLPASFFK